MLLAAPTTASTLRETVPLAGKVSLAGLSLFAALYRVHTSQVAQCVLFSISARLGGNAVKNCSIIWTVRQHVFGDLAEL